MKILSTVAWKSMWKNRTRTVVTIIGIILSAAMFTAVTTLGYSLWSYMVETEIYDTGDYFLKLDYTTQAHIDTLAADERVSGIKTLGMLGYSCFSQQNQDGYTARQYCAVAAGDQGFYDTVSIPLEEGRLPQRSDEIVINRSIQQHLKESGLPCQLGEAVELVIEPRFEAYDGSITLPSAAEAFSRTYTIVGISEAISRLDDYDLSLTHLFTFSDAQDNALWYRVFLKTHDPKDAYTLLKQMPEGVAGSVNTGLLQLYGATPYTNFNTVILWICVVLAAIIMTGSVSLIYNAFSISVSERTKQFGLLSSVGATRKQLRGAVFSEAMLLGGIGIPLGLVCGYVGIAITLNGLSARIHTILSTGDGTILLRPVLSAPALGAAAVIALVTVLICAAIPARRASKISPMDAIRQKNDYAVPKRSIRVSRLTEKLFGLPGVLSRKYYKVSRKKYRATVISLVISIVLFISAASVSQLIHSSMDRAVNTENYDMMCFGDAKTLETIRQQPFVEESACFSAGYYMIHVSDDQLDESFLDCWQAINREYDYLDKNIHDVMVIYLEDDMFRRYLSEKGLPEAPYFSDEIPSALVVAKEVAVYSASAQTGERERFTYAYRPYDAEGAVLALMENVVPAWLKEIPADERPSSTYERYTDEEGNPVLAVVPLIELAGGRIYEDWEHRQEYLIRWDTAQNGITTAAYYERDPVTGAAQETAAFTETLNTPLIKLGATVNELPFGVSSAAVDGYYYNYLILPMSAAPEKVFSGPDLCITVSDYVAAKSYMQTHLGEQNFRDLKESEENNRTIILLINVFSYGFIILISLICVANVFNTISTNVALRRRDFGMLRSTGFREKDLLKMMNYECLSYGWKALAWGLPISLLCSYLIFDLEGKVASYSFIPPWSALVIAALSVFTVVFVTMFYAMSKLRRDNPIDAIRMENI